MWKPVPSRTETKMQLRQVWSHEDFADWFGPELNRRRAGERDGARNSGARDEGGLPARTARGPWTSSWHGVPRPSPRPKSFARREHSVAWRDLPPRHREEAADEEADGEEQDSDSYFLSSPTSSTSPTPSASSTSTGPRPRPRPTWLERWHRRRRAFAAQPRGLRAGRTAHARASSTHRL